jgi:uncharacterized protein
VSVRWWRLVGLPGALTASAFVLSTVSVDAASRAATLIDAARSGNVAMVRTLVRDNRASARAATPDGTTALHWAASNGDLESVKILLAAGANPRASNRYGVTPLALACQRGDPRVVERLLTAGARTTDALPGGETPLMTAARAGNADAVRTLLAHGADVNAREETRRQTPLMWAAAEGNTAVMRALIEGGADVRARSKELDFRNYEPMRGGSAIGDVANGVDIEFSALLFAVRAGKLDAVRLLLDAGADVNETVPDGTSALVIAAINARWEVGTYLLSRGANPNASGQGWTALHQVARTRSLNLGNVPHPVASGSISSLTFTAELLRRGADVNARMTREIRNDGYRFTMSRIGATPYLVAAKGADAALMRLLAENGADTKLANDAGTTPLMAATGVDLAFLGEDTGTHADAYDAVKVALEYPHDLNATNRNGDTALHGAARRGAIPILEVLIARGAKIDAVNKRGWTPLTVALGYKAGKSLFLNEQRQLEAAKFLHNAMTSRGLAINEDEDALALMRSSAPEIASSSSR